MITSTDKKYMYDLISKKGRVNMSVEVFKSKIIGYSSNKALREELQNQPIIAEFCGSMFDGYRYITSAGLNRNFTED